MFRFFGRYAGQMAFSLIGTVLGALIVTKLGLYSPFAPSHPSPASEIAAPAEPATRRIEESHQVIRERLDANQAEANRIAEAERKAKADAADAAARAEEAARVRAAALAAQERARKAAAAAAATKRETTPIPVVAHTPPVQMAGPLPPPVNITPETELKRTNPLEDIAGKIVDKAAKVRDTVVEGLRLDRIFRNPFREHGDDTARSNANGQRFSGLDL